MQKGASLIYKNFPSPYSSPYPLVKSHKANIAGAGEKQSHQVAQNYLTDSTDYSTRLSPHPTSDQAW